MQRKFIIAAICSLLCMPVAAQRESSDIRHGNKEYRKENFSSAEIDYRKGLDKNDGSFEAHYNLGNSLFKQEKYQEALSEYMKADSVLSRGKKDAKRRSQVAHNAGNSLYALGDYAHAVDAYKLSLRDNPKDDETRYNLVKAMQMLQMQEQQQQQQQDKNEENQDKQEQQQQQQQQNKQEEQQNEMSKEQAEQILQALEQDEQAAQEKAQRQQMQGGKRSDKNW